MTKAAVGNVTCILVLSVLALVGSTSQQTEQDVNGVCGSSCLDERVHKLEEENYALKERLQNLQNEITDPIAFSSALTHTATVSTDDTIKFNHVFIDTHNMYSEQTGTATIPKAGIYEVNVNLLKHSSTGDDNAYVDLVVNRAVVSRISVRFQQDPTVTAYGTLSIIQEFKSGDTVNVRAASAASYYGSNVNKGSQFSVKYLGRTSAEKVIIVDQ